MPPSVNMVIDSLHAKGFEAYAVGGCVRDTILAREPGRRTGILQPLLPHSR